MVWWDDDDGGGRTATAGETSGAVVRPPASPAVLAGPGAASNVYTLIYGGKGNGKTTLLRRLFALRIARGGSATFVDRTGRNGDLGTVVTTTAAWWAHVRAARREGRPFALVLQPRRGVDLGPLWTMIYETGRTGLFIDECEVYANSHRIDPALSELVNLGRNRLVDLAVTVRTPPQLHGEIRGNADVVISFRQNSRMYARSLNNEFFHLPDETVFMRLPRFCYLRAEDGRVTWGVLRRP